VVILAVDKRVHSPGFRSIVPIDDDFEAVLVFGSAGALTMTKCGSLKGLQAAGVLATTPSSQTMPAAPSSPR